MKKNKKNFSFFNMLFLVVIVSIDEKKRIFVKLKIKFYYL